MRWREREEGKESTLGKMDERESSAASAGMKATSAVRRADFPTSKERETFVWLLMTDICG